MIENPEAFVPGPILKKHGFKLITRADCQDSVLTVATTGFGVPFYEAMGMHITGRRLVTFGPLEGRELIQLEKRRPNQGAEATS